MPRPTFLILGASKAGTTSLYHYLSDHPDVFMSEPKEPPFFRLEYERGSDYYWQTYFRGYRGEQEIGDAAPMNLYLPFVAPRIAAMLPDARLFVLCRNPIDRAISMYRQNVGTGREARSFEGAIEANLRRLETGPHFEEEAQAPLYARIWHDEALRPVYRPYIEQGYYAEHIERYLTWFPRDRIKVLLFEDLTTDAPGVVADAQAFLGLEQRRLKRVPPHNPTMGRAATAFCAAVARLPGVDRVPPVWRAEVRRRIADRFVGQPPEFSASLRDVLVEHYRPHNQRLAALTGRNLGHWDAAPSPAGHAGTSG